MKDAVATMGAILPDDAGGRDAVHVAVISAVAGQKFEPGQAVGFVSTDGHGEHTAVIGVTPLGIVDPFIQSAVKKGQRFWLYLYPRTITSLRHQWTHPAFSDAPAGQAYGTPAQKLAAEQWIRDFVARSDSPCYEELMEAVTQVADGRHDGWSEDYLCFRGVDAHGEIPDEFWLMAEIVLGRQIKGTKPAYFSCSC